MRRMSHSRGRRRSYSRGRERSRSRARSRSPSRRRDSPAPNAVLNFNFGQGPEQLLAAAANAGAAAANAGAKLPAQRPALQSKRFIINFQQQPRTFVVKEGTPHSQCMCSLKQLLSLQPDTLLKLSYLEEQTRLIMLSTAEDGQGMDGNYEFLPIKLDVEDVTPLLGQRPRKVKDNTTHEHKVSRADELATQLKLATGVAAGTGVKKKRGAAGSWDSKCVLLYEGAGDLSLQQVIKFLRQRVTVFVIAGSQFFMLHPLKVQCPGCGSPLSCGTFDDALKKLKQHVFDFCKGDSAVLGALKQRWNLYNLDKTQTKELLDAKVPIKPHVLPDLRLLYTPSPKLISDAIEHKAELASVVKLLQAEAAPVSRPRRLHASLPTALVPGYQQQEDDDFRRAQLASLASEGEATHNHEIWTQAAGALGILGPSYGVIRTTGACFDDRCACSEAIAHCQSR
jgi:hypothetical protein